MTDPLPKPQTTMGRIAALEARYAELCARLDKLQEVADAHHPLPGEPMQRDPRPTTGADVERAAQWDYDTRKPIRAFRPGFGKETA